MEWIAVGIGLTLFAMGAWWGFNRGVLTSAKLMTDMVLISLEKAGTVRLIREDGEIVKIEPGSKAYETAGKR